MARDLVGELLSREKSMSTQAAPVTNSAQNYDLADKLLTRESSTSKTNKMLTRNPYSSPQEGMVDSITNSAPFNFVLGAGDALKNTIGGAASLLPGVNINPVKSGEGTAYDAGNIAGNIGGFVGGGEALDALRFAGEGIPLVGALAKQLGGNGLRGAARRAIGTGIAGAAENPNDKVGGLEKGAAMSLALDAIPGTVRGLGKAAELVNPQKFTSDLTDSIKQAYEGSIKKASNEYNPVLEKLGNNEIGNKSSQYFDFDKSLIKDYFTPDLKKMHARYVENPTLQNAHDLQSQIFTRINKLSSKKPEAFTSNTVEALTQARDALRNDITSYLKNTNPSLASKYAKGTNIFREEVAPFRENPIVFKIASGKKQTIEPQQLEKSLTNLKENRQLSDKHYLSQALEQLSNKISRGEAIKATAPMLIGGVAGEMLMPGVGSGLLGAFGGHALSAVAKKFGAHSPLELATNPTAIKAAQHLNAPYQALIKSLIANKLEGT